MNQFRSVENIGLYNATITRLYDWWRECKEFAYSIAKAPVYIFQTSDEF